jgi:hypothetical protein
VTLRDAAAEGATAYYVAVAALDAIDRLGPLASPILEDVLTNDPPENPPPRSGQYFERLLTKLRGKN